MSTNYLMKKKIFDLFYKVFMKNNLSTVIQNIWITVDKYFVVFHNKHEINSLHVYYFISCVIFGLFVFFFLHAKYKYLNIFLNVLKFSYYEHVYMRPEGNSNRFELSDVYCIFFKIYFFINNSSLLPS